MDQAASPMNGSTEGMVGPGRFELPTSRLSSARSNQLSYEPVPKVGPRGLYHENALTRPFLETGGSSRFSRIGKGCAGGGV